MGLLVLSTEAAGVKNTHFMCSPIDSVFRKLSSIIECLVWNAKCSQAS